MGSHHGLLANGELEKLATCSVEYLKQPRWSSCYEIPGFDLPRNAAVAAGAGSVVAPVEAVVVVFAGAGVGAAMAVAVFESAGPAVALAAGPDVALAAELAAAHGVAQSLAVAPGVVPAVAPGAGEPEPASYVTLALSCR